MIGVEITHRLDATAFQQIDEVINGHVLRRLFPKSYTF